MVRKPSDPKDIPILSCCFIVLLVLLGTISLNILIHDNWTYFCRQCRALAVAVLQQISSIYFTHPILSNVVLASIPVLSAIGWVIYSLIKKRKLLLEPSLSADHHDK